MVPRQALRVTTNATGTDGSEAYLGPEPSNGGGYDAAANENQQENTEDGMQQWGTIMRDKHENDTRCIGSNINTFPKTKYNFNDKIKFKLLQNLLQQSQVDFFMSQEDNLYIPNVESHLRPNQRCRPLFDNLKITSAYNINPDEASGTHLQGGVSVWAINEMVGPSHSTGTDNSGLGRWVYQRITGKGDRFTRIYSVYRPCKSYGEQTVYAQHTRGLTAEHDDRCPQKAFFEDLAVEINLARADGDMFIIQGDMNMDV